MFSDELTEAILGERVTEEIVKSAVRKATINLQLAPVMMGSAYKNKAVQLLLDGVASYLPSPTDVKNHAVDLDREEERITLSSDHESRS
jgi:elongation factor G